ncbi:hypothetical protein D3C71_111370 [compost metagenome]
MKSILLAFAICYAAFTTHAQTISPGTYTADGSGRDSLMITDNSLFSHQGENNGGTYYGQGTYTIQQDSLYLTYDKDVPGKIVQKARTKRAAKQANGPIAITVYRAASTVEQPAVYGKYIMLELLDKDKKVLRLTELKGDGHYTITDSLLYETAFLRLAGDQDELAPGTNNYLFELRQPINKPTEILLYTYPRLYNQVISNMVINKGKIAIISDRQFVLSDGNSEQTYTKK